MSCIFMGLENWVKRHKVDLFNQGNAKAYVKGKFGKIRLEV